MLQTTTSAEGLHLLSRGDIEGARNIFANLIANKEDLAQANYGLGVIALQERDPATARDRFEACLWHDAQHANALFQLGYIEKQSGNDADAIQYWQRCLKANPTHAGALSELNVLQPPPPPPPQPPLPPGGETSGPVDGGYDVYGLLKRCNSGVELEIVRLLDEIQDMVVSRRQRVRAFIGPFLLFWIVGFGGALFLLSQGPGIMALGLLALVALITLVRVLEIKCNKVECDRYVFVQQKGVLSTRSRNDHLWLMSRDNVLVSRSLVNRLTNDGTLHLGESNYKGFFTGKQLKTIQKSFAQLKLIMPTDREVLAAIGELKNMRTGDK